jgi:hypothetical protein
LFIWGWTTDGYKLLSYWKLEKEKEIVNAAMQNLEAFEELRKKAIVWEFHVCRCLIEVIWAVF